MVLTTFVQPQEMAAGSFSSSNTAAVTRAQKQRDTFLSFLKDIH